MRTRHLVYGLALLLLPSLASPCYAIDAQPVGPSTFVSELAHTAILSVVDEASSPQERQRRLGEFLDKDFDMPGISKFVLGRYWQKATDTERQTFSVAYRDFTARVYSLRFARYNGEMFRVIDQRAENATTTVVSTEMHQPNQGQPLRVDWRVVDNDGYKITDVTVAGVSMALAQREDFAAVLSRNHGDIPGLIQQLEVKTTAMESR